MKNYNLILKELENGLFNTANGKVYNCKVSKERTKDSRFEICIQWNNKYAKRTFLLINSCVEIKEK